MYVYYILYQYYFASAAIIKNYRLGGLNTRNLFSPSCGG